MLPSYHPSQASRWVAESVAEPSAEELQDFGRGRPLGDGGGGGGGGGGGEGLGRGDGGGGEEARLGCGLLVAARLEGRRWQAG